MNFDKDFNIFIVIATWFYFHVYLSMKLCCLRHCKRQKYIELSSDSDPE